MADIEKIGFDSLFDFNGDAELQKAIKAIQALEAEYTQLSKHMTDDSGKINTALLQVADNLRKQESVLKTLNVSSTEQQQKALQVAQAVEAEVKSYKHLEAAQKQAEASNKAYDKTIDELKKSLAGMKKELADATKNANSTEITKLKNELKQTTAETNKLARLAADLTKQLDKQGASAKKAQTSNKAAAGSLKDLSERTSQALAKFKSLGDNIDPFLKSRALENYKKLKTELDSQNGALRDAVKTNNVAEGSYKELTQEVNRLNKELRELPDVFGKNKAQAEALQKTIYEKTQTLKEFDKATNQTWRNVGNYTEGIKEAANASGLFSNELDILNRIQGTLQGLLSATKAKQEGVNAAMLASAPAAAGFSAAMKVIRLALISTGIGAFVVLIGGLIAYLTQTEAGAERLERGLAGLKAVFMSFIGPLSAVGKGLVDAFTNPMDSLKKLGNFLQENLLNRLRAFGVIFEAIKKGDLSGLTNGFLQMGTGVENMTGKMQNGWKATKDFAAAAKAAANEMSILEGRFQDVEDAEREFGVQAEKSRQEVERLVLTAKDRSLSAAQRVANLQKAGAIEERLLKSEVGFAKERADILRAQNALREKAGALRDDDAQAQEDAIKKAVELEGQSAQLQQKIQNRLSVLQEATAKEAQEALIKNLESQKAALETRLLVVTKNSKAELDLKKAIIDKSAQIELAGEEMTAAKIKLIRTQALVDKKALDKEYEKGIKLRSLTEEEAQLNKSLALTEEHTAERLEIALKLVEVQSELEIAGAEMTEAQITAIRAGAARERKDLIDNFYDYQKQKAEQAVTDELERRLTLQDSAETGDIEMYLESLKKREITAAEFDKRIADTSKLYARSAMVAEIESLESLLQVHASNAEEVAKIQEQLNRATQKLRKADLADAIQTEREKLEKKLFYMEQARSITQTAADAAFQFSSYDIERETQALEAQHENNVKIAGDNKEAKIRADEDYQKRKTALEIKAAKREKAAALFSIAINTAAGVASVLSTGGGTRYADFGISAGILSAFVIAQGALQAALVLAKPLPAYFKGRKGGPAEYATVDEKGAEIIERRGGVLELGTDSGPRMTYLGAGDKVYTAKQTETLLNDIMSGNRSTKYLTSIDSASSSLAPVINNNVAVSVGKELKGEFKALKQVIKNKPVSQTNITERGLQTWVESGNGWTNYVNKRYNV